MMNGYKAWTRRGALVVASVMVALACATTAAPARAEVRTVTQTFAVPAEPPSLEPRAPYTQRYETPQSVTVTYDDQAGALDVHLGIYDAGLWSDRLPDMDLFMDTSGCEYPNLLHAEFDYLRVDDPGDPSWDPPVPPSSEVLISTASLTRHGYDGQATGTITPVADGFAMQIQNPALAGLDLRCLQLTGGLFDGNRETNLFFDGYQPVTLTAANATRSFKQALAARYGSAFTAASPSWATCPREEFIRPPADAPFAICMAEFRSHARWHFVSARLDQGELGPVMGKPFTRTWVRRWTRESGRCARRAGVHGRISSNYNACESLMIGDLAYAVRHHLSTRRAYQHGTNTAGFGKVVAYRCHHRGRSTTCTNKLGDAFRWTR